MRTAYVGLITASLWLGCGPCQVGEARSPQPHGSFVTADGMQLRLDGKPWRFLGYDDWYAASVVQASCTGSKPYSAADLEAELSHLEASGIGVLRAWFFQSFALNGGQLDFSGFERLISAAKAHHIRIIAVLTNGQKD